MSEIYLAIIVALFYLVIKITDNKPNKVQYYFKWYCFYLYGLLVATILSFIFIWKGRDIRNLPMFMKWLKPMTKFHGMTWHLENAQVLNNCSGRAVLISNHQSSLDMLGLFHASSAVKTWMPACKKEILYMGPIGLVAYLTGAIFIDRTNSTDAYMRLNKAAEMMSKNDIKIWMFPEGTRNVQKKVKLLPFKKGAFKIAVATQSPIIPVVFSPYYFAFENKPIFENGGHVIMRCLEPIKTTGLTMDDVPALTERLQNIILKTYEEVSKEVQFRFLGADSLAINSAF